VDAAVYAAAKARTSDRSARATRNWSPVPVVRLNPRPATAKVASRPVDGSLTINAASRGAGYATTWNRYLRAPDTALAINKCGRPSLWRPAVPIF